MLEKILDPVKRVKRKVGMGLSAFALSLMPYISGCGGGDEVPTTTNYPVRIVTNRSDDADTPEGISYIDLDGTNQIDNNNSDIGETPTWHPHNQNEIIFPEKNAGGFYDIFKGIIDTSGNIINKINLTNNTTSNDLFPRFALDGLELPMEIVFESFRDGNGEIYSSLSDGTTQTRLTNTINTVRDTRPCFNQDRTKILWQTNRDGNNEIYEMDFDGSGKTNITNNSADDRNPFVALNGNLYFSSNRTGRFQIWEKTPTGNLTQITNVTDNAIHPAVSKDGRKLAYTVRDMPIQTFSDIYIRDVNDLTGTTETLLLGQNSSHYSNPDFSR